MSAIGAILIIVGFILGVYCGVQLSLPRVIVSDSGKIKHDKLNSITVLCVVSVVLVVVGQYLFFKFPH